MTTPRLRGYRPHTEEHPGAENYPTSGAGSAGGAATDGPGMPRDYRGFGGAERPSYPSKYTPDYLADLDANYGADYDAEYDGYDRRTDDDYDGGDIDEYDEVPDRRWKWVAGAAAAVLLAAIVVTISVVSSSDDSQTATTSVEPTAPRTVIATAPALTPSPAPSPTATLPPETVTTVTPAPEAAPVPPPVEEGAPPPAPAPGTITYTVTGSRQLFDLVSIIYTDEQGLPRTDVNVALPWTRTVVLNPGVENMSVTATSLMGQLNCSITDAQGTPIITQDTNVMIAACTK